MEKLMQYVWQHRLCIRPGMRTVDGRRLQIIDPGLLNTDSGPDFFKATVIIGDQTWVGSVEIHVRASDWHRHHHDGDPAYNNVVLHVVEKDDCAITRPNGEVIPQMVMQCVPEFHLIYKDMVFNTTHNLSCHAEIQAMPKLYITDWISALGFERLHTKAERITAHLAKSGGNWMEATYLTLARALGFGTNSEPFELMAQTTPIKALMRHSNSSLALEALLMGQASFLNEPAKAQGSYYCRLRDEYAFMARKFSLMQSASITASWKMARMRPQNFPHRRIAALAALLRDGFPFAGSLLHVTNLDQARALFDVKLSPYWTENFNFSKEHDGDYTDTDDLGTLSAFSSSSIDILVINVVVPMLFAYGMATDNSSTQDTAVDMLMQLKPESNRIIQIFGDAGVECKNAFTSQALIQLRKNYCNERKCLYCRIGHRMLSQKAIRL